MADALASELGNLRGKPGGGSAFASGARGLSLIHFLRAHDQSQSEWLNAISSDQTISKADRQRALQLAGLLKNVEAVTAFMPSMRACRIGITIARRSVESDHYESGSLIHSHDRIFTHQNLLILPIPVTMSATLFGRRSK